MMGRRAISLGAAAFACVSSVVADDLLYNYECDVVPYHESAGWVIYNPCDPPCEESSEDGHFVLRWPVAGDRHAYALFITMAEKKHPAPFWAEWSFSSNHPFNLVIESCDAFFLIRYAEIEELVDMYGDAAIAFSAKDLITGLELGALHTFRLESEDGDYYEISVDGTVFIRWYGDRPSGDDSLQIGGRGGCTGDQVPNKFNEWDFVRYGTIAYGEKIVATDPPAGFLRAADFPALDRFTVRFDQPNYVYVDEIGVEAFDADGNRQQATGNSVGWAAPTDSDPSSLRPSVPPSLSTVIATRRLDNGPPDVVEIVLDQPIQLDARTVFTFNDGAIRQTVAYTYILGDVNADGRFDLRDIGEFQSCFFDEFAAGRCWAFDFDATGYISLEDYAKLRPLLTGPE
jgi:hypothetical protein